MSNDIEDQNGLEVLRVVMDKADHIPEMAELIWNIAMTNIPREKDGRLILCRNVKESRELYVKIGKAAWEYKRAVGKPFHRRLEADVVGGPRRRDEEHDHAEGVPELRLQGLML